MPLREGIDSDSDGGISIDISPAVAINYFSSILFFHDDEFFRKKEKRSTAVNGIRDVGIETIGRTNNDSQAAGINYKSRQKVSGCHVLFRYN